MALSTDTYWDINGVPLQTYAYNVTTWGGDLQAPPPLRGDDLTIPYRPGQVFQSRRPNGRSLTFNMWVQGSDVDGKVPSNKTMRAEFENNFKMLRNLFWNRGRQVTITKRWRDYATGTMMSASAKGVYSGGFSPSMQGNLHASFSVEMYLADPFFYGPEEPITFTASATSNRTVDILGDYETSNITIDFNGSRVNPRMTNTSEGVYVNLQYSIATGQVVRLNVDAWTARRNPSSDNTNLIGSVTNFGHEFWMILAPGTQTLSLTSTSGTGTATLKYRPRWL